jgi:hypothetical protein
MKQIVLFLTLGSMLLAACGAQPATSAPQSAQTEMPAPVIPEVDVLPSSTSFVPTATEGVEGAEGAVEPKLPAASFEAQPYVNQAAGFALDIPAGWTVNEMPVGDRGSQVQFLSSPELADAAIVPEGATRVSATIYQWDPKNDLAAYVANRKAAWESSGFQILDEKELVLEQGLPAVQFTIQTPERQAVFLLAALRDQYLEVSGEGDLALVREIGQRLRPISP